MRAPLVITLSVAGVFAGIAAAAAADLPVEYSSGYGVIGEPAAPQVIYQYEPGVVVRAYWLPPWRDRHYFPHSNRRPRLGRREYFSALRKPARLAETYARSWSNAAAFPMHSFIAAPMRRPPPQRYEQFPPVPATPNS
jgi:hypothetical protein